MHPFMWPLPRIAAQRPEDDPREQQLTRGSGESSYCMINALQSPQMQLSFIAGADVVNTAIAARELSELLRGE